MRRLARWFLSPPILAASAIAVQGSSIAAEAALNWIDPGATGNFPASATYTNQFGELGVLSTDGVQMKGHPFFTPLGENGRACVSCHQPAYAMSVSAAGLRERWRATQGKDPVFAAIDGSNCPSLPQ